MRVAGSQGRRISGNPFADSQDEQQEDALDVALRTHSSKVSRMSGSFPQGPHTEEGTAASVPGEVLQTRFRCLHNLAMCACFMLHMHTDKLTKAKFLLQQVLLVPCPAATSL